MRPPRWGPQLRDSYRPEFFCLSPTVLTVGYYSPVRIIFILPDLLHPVSQRERYDLRSLKYLLARSDMEFSPEADGRLLFLSSIMPGHQVITESQAAYWWDFLKFPAGYCYYCEPVHLRADLSDAIVFDRSQFTLTVAEARLLVDAINRYLQEDDSCRVELAGSGRWYLLSENEIARPLPTLREMERRPVGAVLTDSTLDSGWRRLMNELQIVLHHQPVNIERERRGELPLNGVWIHAGAVVQSPEYAVKRVVTKSAFAQAACRKFSLDCAEELGESEFACNGSDTLIFDETFKECGPNCGPRLEWMERHWFKRVYSWLRQGKVDEIIIDPTDGRRFIARRSFLNRFWKRSKPLDAYVKHDI